MTSTVVSAHGVRKILAHNNEAHGVLSLYIDRPPERGGQMLLIAFDVPTDQRRAIAAACEPCDCAGWPIRAEPAPVPTITPLAMRAEDCLPCDTEPDPAIARSETHGPFPGEAA